MPLRLDELTTLRDLDSLEPEWRALWQQDPWATPFQGPDWLLPWTRHLWGGGKLWVLAIRDGANLVAVAPFFFWGLQPRPHRNVSFLGSGITDHLGLTVLPKFAAPAARLVLDAILRRRDDWENCDLQEVSGGSPLATAAHPLGLKLKAEPCEVCPVVALPATYDALLERLDPRFRRNLRRDERNLRKKGEVQFVRAESDGLMQALFELHAARWEQKNEEGVLDSARLRRFHLEVAGRLARAGTLRLFGLQVGGRLIGVQYNLAAKGRAFLYLQGFDPEWSRFSPGSLMVAESIRAAIEEGAFELDFLRKSEPFKYAWGARDRWNYRLRITQALPTEDEEAA